MQYQGGGLVKTVQFRTPKYIGDPINAVKIFNEKEVDELAFIDIEATRLGKEPDYNKIDGIASECFMPMAYGGGIKTLEQIKRIFDIGVEKVIINTSAYQNPKLLTEAASIYGKQSIVVSIDIKKNLFGKYRVYINSGRFLVNENPVDYAKRMENAGAGELIITSIKHEGCFTGYDIDLLKSITSAVRIPVVANGGASKVEDTLDAVLLGGAAAVAAGSLFVFKSENRGVLINYPTQKELTEKVYQKINYF